MTARQLKFSVHAGHSGASCLFLQSSGKDRAQLVQVTSLQCSWGKVKWRSPSDLIIEIASLMGQKFQLHRGRVENVQEEQIEKLRKAATDLRWHLLNIQDHVE